MSITSIPLGIWQHCCELPRGEDTLWQMDGQKAMKFSAISDISHLSSQRTRYSKRMTAFRDWLLNCFNDAVCQCSWKHFSFAPFLPRISNIKPSSSCVPEIKNGRKRKEKKEREKKQDREEKKKCLFYDMGLSSRTTLNVAQIRAKQSRGRERGERERGRERERESESCV